MKAINLKEDDYVASGKPLNGDKDQLILVTQRGAVKRLKASEIEKSTRAKRGLVIFKELNVIHTALSVLKLFGTMN